MICVARMQTVFQAVHKVFLVSVFLYVTSPMDYHAKMWNTIAELPAYRSFAEKHLSEEERQAIIDYLAEHPNGHGKLPPLIMKLAMPVSPYPTFPRKREKEQTNRCASFTLRLVMLCEGRVVCASCAGARVDEAKVAE